MFQHFQLMYDCSTERPLAFGAILRHLRVRHAEEPDTVLSSALATCGCPLGVLTYRAIERGDDYPEDALIFLDAVSRALRLDDNETEVLITHFAYEILARELGEDLAHDLVNGPVI